MEFAFHLELNDDLFRFNTKSVLYSSKETLQSILVQFYKDFKFDLFENIKAKEENVRMLYETFNQTLYKENFNDLNVLFEVVNADLKKKYYFKFELDQTLESQLLEKSFIEYPTLYIVKTNKLNKYDIKNLPVKINDEPKNNSNQTMTSSNNSQTQASVIINKEATVYRTKPPISSQEDLEDGECDDDDDEEFMSLDQEATNSKSNDKRSYDDLVNNDVVIAKKIKE